MGEKIAVESVDEEIAHAVGLLLLSDATLYEAADAAGVTQWELEEAIEDAGLAEVLDVSIDKTASDTLDSLFDDE